MGDLGGLSARRGVKLVWAVDGGDLRDEVAGFGQRVVVDCKAAAEGPADFAPCYGDAAEIQGAIVVGDEVYKLSIRRKPRIGGHAVKSLSQNLGRAARRRRKGDVNGGVIEQTRLELGKVGNPLTVWRPVGSGIGSGIRSDLREVSALVGIVGRHDPNIGVVSGVGIGLRAITAESDGLAVGCPVRL